MRAWISSHKKTAIGIALAVVLLIAGGSIFAPGGVTNYTKSWTGSSWNVTWYVCE